MTKETKTTVRMKEKEVNQKIERDEERQQRHLDTFEHREAGRVDGADPS